jgi:hypothetical protein
LEEEEEKQREEVLAERHKLKEEATQRFQKESLNKKKTRPNSGKESGQTGKTTSTKLVLKYDVYLCFL